MSKEIVQVTHYFSTHLGGVELVAGKLADKLTDIGVNVTWIASDNDAVPESNSTTQYIPIPTSNWLEKKIGIPYPLWTPLKFWSIFKQIKKADGVVIHDTLYMGNILAFIFAKLTRTPMVTILHVGQIDYKSKLARYLMLFANNTIGRVLVKFTDYAIAISNTTKEYFSKISQRKDIYLIFNGLDVTIFNRELTSSHYKKDELLEGKDQLLLFVGRFVEKKGLLLIRELSRKLSNCQFILVGQGAINPNGWESDNIKCLHNLTPKEIAHLMHLSDLFILPSIGEGFPLVLQEAIACGSRVLTSSENTRAMKDLDHYVFSEQVDLNDLKACAANWHIKINEILENEKVELMPWDMVEKQWSENNLAQKCIDFIWR